MYCIYEYYENENIFRVKNCGALLAIHPSIIFCQTFVVLILFVKFSLESLLFA